VQHFQIDLGILEGMHDYLLLRIKPGNALVQKVQISIVTFSKEFRGPEITFPMMHGAIKAEFLEFKQAPIYLESLAGLTGTEDSRVRAQHKAEQRGSGEPASGDSIGPHSAVMMHPAILRAD
jgi:hypothetical protein